MLKIKLFFCATSRNRFFNQFISVTKTNLTGIAASANKAIRRYKNVLCNASLPLAKTFAVAGFSFFITANANAQCNAFQNADAANPLLSVFPAGKRIAGFAFADINGDGLQDVYVSYYNGSTPPKGDKLHLFLNIGTKEHAIFKEDLNTGFGQQLAGPQNEYMQLVDIDGDGDLDYFTSEDPQYYNDAASILFYRNDGTAQAPKFVASSADFIPFDIRSYIYQPFVLADMDGDGDYDLYACDISYFNLNSYNQRIYFNKGTKTNPVFNTYVSNTIADGTSRTYYDWNKDGLVDFFTVASFYTTKGYYKNIGPKETPQYVNATKEGPTFKNGGPYRMIDLNNDGAPEVFDFRAHYSTLAPVAIIQDTIIRIGNKNIRVLTSLNQSASYQYRWEYNGKTIPGANNYNLTARLPGIYTLYVTDDCGIGVSLNDTVSKNNVQTEQGNDRLSALTNATVLPFTVKSYPNPFTNTFTLQLSGANERTESMVKITDLAGRVFLSQRMSAPSVQLGQRLPNGIYNIQVWQGGELVYHTITMKQ